jgi:hypothetical protein
MRKRIAKGARKTSATMSLQQVVIPLKKGPCLFSSEKNEFALTGTSSPSRE